MQIIYDLCCRISSHASYSLRLSFYVHLSLYQSLSVCLFDSPPLSLFHSFYPCVRHLLSVLKCLNNSLFPGLSIVPSVCACNNFCFFSFSFLSDTLSLLTSSTTIDLVFFHEIFTRLFDLMHTQALIHTHTHTNTCTYTHARTHTHMLTHTHTYIQNLQSLTQNESQSTFQVLICFIPSLLRSSLFLLIENILVLGGECVCESVFVSAGACECACECV